MNARRPATRTDLDLVVETIALAFADDPVWGVALALPDGRTEHQRDYWRVFVEGAHALGGIRLVDDGAAVSVWIPDGAAEMSPELAERLRQINLTTLGPDRTARMEVLYERFEASRPKDRHSYLSLLATHPEHRGQGLGMALLAADLEDWDAAGIPTYLESTNPANDRRYGGVGFAPIGSVRAVEDDAVITAMWRDVGAGAG